MINPGTKFYPIELVRALGTNRKAPVKVGDQVPKWEKEGNVAKSKTKVVGLYKDLLENETWITQYTL